MAEETRLKVGEAAPEFKIQALDGSEVSLAEHKGKPIWLAFFRYAMCPLCNFRVHQLLSVWPQHFANRNFVMFGIFQSPGRKLEGLVNRHDPPFTIIADPGMELYTIYRLEASFKGIFGAEVRAALAGARQAGIPVVRPWDGPAHRVPADFLIGKDGTIQNAFYGENVAQHIPFDQVSSFLDAQGH